ncbi:MAG TPA: hypothetical protein VMI12_16865 [Puia sp.]|nr:hypothetical protein [Puia sp.]
MKKICIILASLIFVWVSECSAQQNMDAKPVLVHTIYINVTTANRSLNIDSLLKIFKHYVLDANQYYTNNKIIKHWYGHDSREIIIICELKSWSDIEKAENRQDEILGHLPSSLDEGGKMWSLFIFPEHHSDEIYRVVAE